ncbi:hypothetical protein U1Q18_016790 [Sarracenia purpurea var. burkii]
MGTKLHSKSYLPGYYSMRDLNEDCSSSNWPLFYGDRTLANGQYCNGFLPRHATNADSAHEKYALKQTMLEHEAIFKHQVFELHRLYKIQKDMMDEIRRKELYKHRIPIVTSSSSSKLVSQMPSEDAEKWRRPTVALANSICPPRPSASGAEIINSALSCTERNDTESGQIPFQNGCSSNDCVVLESRPSKVRKKFFDLQLPADNYIDTDEEEQSLDNKTPDISSCPPSENYKSAFESSVKLDINGGSKINCDGDASRSGSCLKGSFGLADLNEPIQVEEATLPTFVDLIGRAAGHTEIEDLDLAAKTKSKLLLGLPMEILQNSQRGSNNGTSINLHIENKGNGRECLSYIYEAGLQPDKSRVSSQLKHSMVNKAHQSVGVLPSDHNRGDLWTKRPVHDLELFEKSRDLSSFNHVEPVATSHVPNPFPLHQSSDFDNALSHSISNWGKQSCSLTQKSTSIQEHPPFNSLGSLNGCSPSTAQSHEFFGNKWHLHRNSGSRPGFGSGLTNCSGYNTYHGFLPVSKDAQTRCLSVGFDYLNSGKNDKIAAQSSINYNPRSCLKDSHVIDTSAKDMNWSTILSKCSSNEAVSQQGLEIVDEEERKCEDHLKVFPWLKAKPACKNEDTRDSNSSDIESLQAVSNQLSGRSEIVKGPNQLFTPNANLASCDHEIGAKRNAVDDCLVSRKILGYSIFDNPCTPKNDSSSLVSTSASLRCTQGEDGNKEGKTGLIDINLACDPECGTQFAAEVLVVEKKRDKEVANFRTHIDLNSCASEDEITLVPSVASSSVIVKIAVEIDLEAPAFPETKEEDIRPDEEQQCDEMPPKSPQQNAEPPQDEAARNAAEAIVAISTCGRPNHVEETTCHLSEAPSIDCFLWFVEVVSTFGDDVNGKFGTVSKGKSGRDNDISSCVVIDDFEAMTLKLTEIKEEEYMPKPLDPERQVVEETGTISVQNRPRKGQSRRGRQRRDFQRDILPGLASLSRHEVTEDLQTFGGLMRATGHPWQSGLTRRNGTRNGSAARGRRRSIVDPPPPTVAASTVCTPLIQQLNSIEVGLVDRSLTGWGKTPRRPRRQRCPAGNPPPSIPLT